MSNTQKWFDSWVDRLAVATDYRELQAIFNEMAVEAQNSEDAAELARTIDESIRRIEHERISDEQELQAFEKEYAEFKEQQSGVLGWFKRTMPFTATRASEKQHRSEITEQQAEVLADNFIIARAQVLKEKFLPNSYRRLGNDPDRWHQLLLDADGQINELAQVIRELGTEIERSEKFINEVDEDIEAFHKADFHEWDDDRLKKDEIKTARKELAPLQDELKREKDLRSGAMTQVRDSIHRNLHQQNSTYRELSFQIEKLEVAEDSIRETEKTAKEIESVLENIVKDSGELDSISSKIENRKNDVPRLEARLHEKRRHEADAKQNMQQYVGSFESASGDARAAEAALKTAERIYYAHLNETGQAEAVPGMSSPVQREYEKAKESLENAKRNLDRARRPYDNAKRLADQAQSELHDVEKKLKENSQRISKLQKKQNKLLDGIARDRDRMSNDRDRIQDQIRGFLAESGEFFQDSQVVDALNHTNRAPRFSIGHNPTQEFKNDKRKAEEFLQAVQVDRSHIGKELEETRNQYREIYLQRCRELLGEDLVAEFE